MRRGAKASSLKLQAERLRNLDLGPAADGTPTAVYTRCTPNCDVYAFALISRPTAPIAVRYAVPVIPDSPASESCDEGSYQG